MSKSTPALDKLALELSVLKARDAKRTREIRALRGDLDAIERTLTDERQSLLRALADNPLPVDSAPVSSSHSWRSWAAAACNRLRFFFRRLFSR